MKLIDSNVFFQFWRNESSNVLTICFSALLDKPPKFTFWRTLKSVNTNILFCNSSGSNWYRTGIEGINGGIYGFVKYVESICTRFSITRVVTIGSSMGGYGALLYGSLLKVDSVLTFGLEPLLGIPGGRNDRTRNMYQYIYPDLTIFSNYPRIYNFFGQLDLADSLGACLLFKKCSAAVFNIQNATHNVPKILYFKSQLVDLFDSFIANDTLLTKKFKQTFCFEDESFVKLLWLINRPLYDNKLQEVKRILVNNLETTMKYELLEFIYAKILYKTNLFEESKEIFFDLIRKINDYYEFYLYMSSICFKLFLKNRMLVNLFEDAKKYAITALELDPEKSAVHVNLSKIYESENDLDKAILHMTWACKLHTETLYDSYVSRLKVLLKKARKPFIPFNKESLIQDKRVNLKHVDALFRK